MSSDRPAARPWLRFARNRGRDLLTILVTLVVLTFFMVRLIPGDPAQRIAGPEATPEVVSGVRARLGLDQSTAVQFRNYITGLAKGDLGNSFLSKAPVGSLLLVRLPYTLYLAGLALLFVMVIGYGLGMGVAIATHEDRNKLLDHSFTAISGVLGAIPELVTAILLAFIFAVVVKIFPVSGARSPSAIVLPMLAIAIRPAINLARVVRVEAGNALRSDYMRTARSKRLPPRILYLRHMAPNVATAALTIGGLLFPFLVGGTVVVENVFAWPGIGTTVVQAVRAADYPLIQGCVLLLGLLVVVANAIVDLALTVVDPRSLVAK